jgi:hypothetical protein
MRILGMARDRGHVIARAVPSAEKADILCLLKGIHQNALQGADQCRFVSRNFGPSLHHLLGWWILHRLEFQSQQVMQRIRCSRVLLFIAPPQWLADF